MGSGRNAKFASNSTFPALPDDTCSYSASAQRLRSNFFFVKKLPWRRNFKIWRWNVSIWPWNFKISFEITRFDCSRSPPLPFFSVPMADNELKQGFEDPLTLIGNLRGYCKIVDKNEIAPQAWGWCGIAASIIRECRKSWIICKFCISSGLHQFRRGSMCSAPNRRLSHFFSVPMADNELKQGFEDPLTLIGNWRGYCKIVDKNEIAP